MALKGEAKKAYQREYMRGYMRNLRLKQQLLRPSTSRAVRPTDEEILVARKYLDDAPINPLIFGTTTNAKGWDYIDIEIDADGNAIYEEG